MVCFNIEIYRKLFVRKRKRMLDWSLKQSLLWAQVSQLTFYIFVKVGYYPLLPLACACILVYTVVVYCIWSYIVIVIWLTLNSAYNEVTFNKKLAIMKENLRTKYTPFTYMYIVLNENPPITKQNLHIFFSL